MAKRKSKKRGFPVFYTIYWTLVIAALAGIGYVCYFGWGWCEAYEQALPKYVAEPYRAIYTEGRVEEMIELCGGCIELKEYETEQDYVDYVKGLLEGKTITCEAEFGTDKDRKVYKAKADGATFSEFTLRKSSEPYDDVYSPYEFFTLSIEKWEFEGMTMDIPAPETTYTVKALSNYQVLVNGMPLSEEYITQRDIETFAAGRLPGNIYTPTFHVYTFSSHFGAPEISVVNAEGEEGVLIPDEGSANGWHMELEYQDERIRPKMEERVLKAAKAYATFVSEDSTRYNIMQYVLPDSAAEDMINAYDNDWFTPHSNYYFSHEVTHNYYLFADNCFSVDVQMAFHMSASNGKEMAYPCVYRFYWGYSASKEEWLIFDFDLLTDYDYDLHDRLDAQAQAGAEE